MSVYQMKQQLAELGQELRTVSDEIRAKAGDPGVKIEELRELKTKQGTVEERFNLLKGEIDKVEAEQRTKMERQRQLAATSTGTADTDQQRMIAAKADLIRSAILGRPVSDETRNLLAGLPAGGASGGDKFLPTNMSNQLISEPLTTNPLRGVIGMSNIKGLELPKISFTLDDDAFITDAETAKEIALTGDKVSFGRNKFKVKARISDTVLHGSDVDLVNYVDNALRSGLAAKEKKVSFAAAPPAAEDHMSFYRVGITQVNGDTTLKAIKAALAALHEDYREAAKVCMRYADFLDILEVLANNNAALWDAPPERIIGKPTFFSDSAVDPIVGNWSYARLNYDGALIYDSDKDVDAGEYLFVLTAWFDQQILLKSAFRVAKVTPPAP